MINIVIMFVFVFQDSNLSYTCWPGSFDHSCFAISLKFLKFFKGPLYCGLIFNFLNRYLNRFNSGLRLDRLKTITFRQRNVLVKLKDNIKRDSNTLALIAKLQDFPLKKPKSFAFRSNSLNCSKSIINGCVLSNIICCEIKMSDSGLIYSLA